VKSPVSIEGEVLRKHGLVFLAWFLSILWFFPAPLISEDALKPKAQESELEYVMLGEGETLEVVALRYYGDEAAAEEIRAFNSLPPGRLVKPGDRLKLPSRSERKLCVAAIQKISEVITQLEVVGLAAPDQAMLDEAVGIRETCLGFLKKAEYGRVMTQGDQAILLLNKIYKKVGGRTVFDVEIRNSDKQNETSLFTVQKGKVKLATGKEQVTLKGGEVGIVDPAVQKIAVKELLSPPEAVEPENGAVFYKEGVSLTWSKLEGAVSYLVEIARDPRFSNVYLEKSNSTTTLWLAKNVPDGRYFWRVRGVDGQGIVGRSSENRFFDIQLDQVPPEVQVDVPIWK
jgi:hypothetical protein